MRCTALYGLLLTVSLLISFPAQARVIRVPQDQQTIQGAIDAAENNDTVRVAVGTYTGGGNIDILLDKRIVLISDSCLIDCENADEVSGISMTQPATVIGVAIANATWGGMKIINCNGFIIRNCWFNWNFQEQENTSGAGLVVDGSTGIIKNCIFTSNDATQSGAGMLIKTSSSVTIWNCIFTGNDAERYGGGVLVTSSSEAEIGNCIFDNNRAGIDGGGVELSVSASAYIYNCTFTDNVAEGYGGGLNKGSSSNPEIVNCIFWGNEGGTGNQLYEESNGGSIDISYCCVQDSIVPGDRWSGENIIASDPELRRGRVPEWGIAGFFLDNESPCVDAGAGASSEFGMDTLTTQTDYVDDEETVDLGFHYNFNDFNIVGSISGFVYNHADGAAIGGAHVLAWRGEESWSAYSGWQGYSMNNVVATRPISITVSADGFIDTTVTDIIVPENRNVEVNFRLLHATFDPSEQEITTQVEIGDSSEVGLTIENFGNGALNWTVEPRVPAQNYLPEWMLHNSYPASTLLNDGRLEGVVYTGTNFIVAGRNYWGGSDDSNMVYILGRDSVLVDSFIQADESNNGFKGLAWNGQLVWGGGGHTIYGFTPEGEVFRAWEGPFSSHQGLAWDSDQNLLWMTGITANRIYAYTADGEPADTLDRPAGFRIYGMAYYSRDPDGYKLYILHDVGGRNVIHKLNTETADTIYVSTLIHIDGGSPAGAFISKEYDSYNWVFMNIADNGAEDRIDIWQLAGNTTWMSVDPLTGSVQPDQSQELLIKLYTAGFDLGRISGDLYFTHNAEFGEVIIPIHMEVIMDAPPGSESEIPGDFRITGVYPNPFNSQTLVNYDIPMNSDISMKLFDLTGREVMEVLKGKINAGTHTVSISADILPTGVYLLRLEAEDKMSIAKLVLIK